MRTIGYGLLQIPLLTIYRDTFLRKRPLSNCVAGTAGKMIFQNALRMTLLCVWGLQNVNYSYPRSSEKMFAIYIEMGTLGVGIIVGVITVFAYCFKKIPLLYPALVSIPVCFIIDFFIKATCYAYLFLYPYITMFGIFSLIEIWWRHLTLLYHWVALISFIYTSKDFVDPFTGKTADEPVINSAPISTVSGGTGMSNEAEKKCVLTDYKSTSAPPWSPVTNKVMVDDGGGENPGSSADHSPSAGHHQRDVESMERGEDEQRGNHRNGGFVPNILKSGEVDASQIEFECDDDDESIGFAPENKKRRSRFGRKSNRSSHRSKETNKSLSTNHGELS